MTTRDVSRIIGNPYANWRFQSRPRVSIEMRRRLAVILVSNPLARIDAVLRLKDCGCDVSPATTLGAIIDLAANRCEWNGMEVACNIIREYDDLTGANHFEYAMPEETGNVNIWRVNADNTLTYQKPTQTDLYPITEAPVLNYQNTPTVYDDPVFYHPQTPETVHVTSPAPTAPPPPIRAVDPPALPPRPTAPPPGWWNYGDPSNPYRSNVRQQPRITATLPPQQPIYTLETNLTPGTATTTGSGQGTGQNTGSGNSTGGGSGSGNNPIVEIMPTINDPIGAPAAPALPGDEQPGIIDRLKEAPGWAIAAAVVAAGFIITSRSR